VSREPAPGLSGVHSPSSSVRSPSPSRAQRATGHQGSRAASVPAADQRADPVADLAGTAVAGHVIGEAAPGEVGLGAGEAEAASDCPPRSGASSVKASGDST